MLNLPAQIQLTISEAHELISALAWLRDNHSTTTNTALGMVEITAAMNNLYTQIMILDGQSRQHFSSMKIKQKVN